MKVKPNLCPRTETGIKKNLEDVRTWCYLILGNWVQNLLYFPQLTYNNGKLHVTLSHGLWVPVIEYNPKLKHHDCFLWHPEHVPKHSSTHWGMNRYSKRAAFLLEDQVCFINTAIGHSLRIYSLQDLLPAGPSWELLGFRKCENLPVWLFYFLLGKDGKQC